MPNLDGEVLPVQHLHLAQRISLQLLGLDPARHVRSPRASGGLQRRLHDRGKGWACLWPCHAHPSLDRGQARPLPSHRQAFLCGKKDGEEGKAALPSNKEPAEAWGGALESQVPSPSSSPLAPPGLPQRGTARKLKEKLDAEAHGPSR